LGNFEDENENDDEEEGQCGIFRQALRSFSIRWNPRQALTFFQNLNCLKSFETKTGAAGLCQYDMNRFYMKPTVNPAFKLCQPLPVPHVAGKSNAQTGFSGAASNIKLTPAIHEPARGGSTSLCKNFAFSNLF